MPRALDLVVALLLLALTAPLMIVLAAAIAIVDRRPVLFRQSRSGRHGARFQMCKFRTLRADAAADRVADAAADRVAVGVAPESDPRITPLGRWLRRARLDELPQLFHVLSGSMALVGPRPETPEHLRAVPSELLAQVLRCRPGLTGPTQLAFLAEDSVLAEVEDPEGVYTTVLVPAKVRHGVEWLARRTILGDLGTLLRTPLAMLSQRARRRSRARIEALLRAQAGDQPGGSEAVSDARRQTAD